MARLEDTIERYKGLIREVGKRTLHALFPNDFEFYMVSFELVDSKGNTVDFFIFPIMPSQLREDEVTLTNIKKTFGGIVSLDTNTFIPRKVSLSGNFGRKFKFLLGEEVINFAGVRFTSFEEGLTSIGATIGKSIFSSKIKTGYGCTKVLESILKKSKMLDEEGKPFRLYFYNSAFGTNYLVKTNNFSFSQNENSSNMIWEYNINMTAVAPLELLEEYNNSALPIALGADFINKKLTKTVSKIRRQLF